ncbi:unnamed protein product [Ilex paraguariensis]|uniref:Uncharacterized protein n=1 Tax=Ilex paraguariensis TaxID=185542 RepID=A0ABC8REA5_9AQUA
MGATSEGDGLSNVFVERNPRIPIKACTVIEEIGGHYCHGLDIVPNNLTEVEGTGLSQRGSDNSHGVDRTLTCKGPIEAPEVGLGSDSERPDITQAQEKGRPKKVSEPIRISHQLDQETPSAELRKTPVVPPSESTKENGLGHLDQTLGAKIGKLGRRWLEINKGILINKLGNNALRDLPG